MSLRTVVWFVAVVGLADEAGAQEPVREPVQARDDANFHPSLLLGVRRLAREHVRIAECGLRIQRGDAAAAESLLAEVVAGLPEVERGAVRADPPDAETLAEMLLSWKGSEAFPDVVADAERIGRPLRVEHLLEVVWSDRLRELPDARDEPEVAAFLAKIEELAGQPVPVRLWWPTVGYLIFGALHAPSYWPADPDERARRRAALIQDLLELASVARDPEAVRRVVDVALAPPLAGRCVRKGVTCARKNLARLRGPVGFTREHLDFVSRFNANLDAERRTGAPASAWAIAYRHLADFMASMKLRILLELDPAIAELPGPLACKHGTLAEARTYYQQILAERGVQSFWIEARGDVEKILGGRFPHPSDARVAALRERLSDPGLAAEERRRLERELGRLEQERWSDQCSLATFVTYQLGDLAPVDQAMEELHRLEKLANPFQQTHELMAGWAALGMRDPGWARALVKRRFDEGDAFGESAIHGAAMALSRHADDPESARALFDLATRGTPRERGAAMMYADRLPEEVARGVFETAVADVESLLQHNPDVVACRPFGDDELYTELLGGAVGILYARRREPWAAEALRRTFDRAGVNLWQGGSPFAHDVVASNREVLEWVCRTLPEADWRRLLEQRRIPAELEQVHGELARR